MEKIRNIEASLKMFIRGEVGPLNKELAKKSKDLFMTSSDLETLREEIEIVKGELNKTALELCRK